MGCPGAQAQEYEAKGQCEVPSDRETTGKPAGIEGSKPGQIYASRLRKASSACAFHRVKHTACPASHHLHVPQAPQSAVHSHTTPPARLPTAHAKNDSRPRGGRASGPASGHDEEEGRGRGGQQGRERKERGGYSVQECTFVMVPQLHTDKESGGPRGCEPWGSLGSLVAEVKLSPSCQIPDVVPIHLVYQREGKGGSTKYGQCQKSKIQMKNRKTLHGKCRRL